MKIYDISRGLLSAPVYTGDAPVRVEKTMDMKNGDLYNSSKITVGSHNGTHADAFCHFIDGEITIDKMDLSYYYGKCRVVTVEKDKLIHKEDLIGKIEGAEKIALRCGTGYFAKDGAEYVVECGIKTVVTEHLSIGGLDTEKEIHEIVLGNHVAVIENVILDGIDDGEYILSAFPIKIDNCDGGFVRAVLIE